ncbi:hypothetical protein ASPZODRAFT_76489 [Penicilliopsis zonata CBS 506.65]|uniref:Zn(2)-C6 fungal-type domain-containing protein n=1 Tax=Penicilliopsis zonata CBS 506.65 TaxID=1073090 RepID=A0A1L9S5V6_9EURO|nr:hypothetical protein ASPZODRAFT_76489 [Penicilliopsis zonata CBS 506.65]OJJ42544.1 hypothetical protein ASPZODRAFT_76489 [Penicilliopsis zonata CBS 506.65]
MPLPGTTRPYRSHKIPACDFCRRRKSRCTQDVADQPCLLCRMHGAECSRTGMSTVSRPVTARKRLRKSSDAGESHQPAAPAAAGADDGTQSDHIVGPAMARDAQVLGQYETHPNPYSVYSDDSRNPVVYMKVPRQRNVVPSGNGTAGFRQFETMEKIVEPLGAELSALYWERVHPAFPVLDEETVREAYAQDMLPHTLGCEVYAGALVWWSASPVIAASRRPLPDVRYLWNLAVSALNDDFLAPTFSTVLACVLDLAGRPITSIKYNAVNTGRVVALSQSLGLNRNPSRWGLDHRQTSLRIRTWWAVFIHDQWVSLSHGTPPHIHRSQWDVPIPDADTLLLASSDGTPVSTARRQGGQSFIALCRLTVLLGNVLPMIYTLHPQSTPDASFSELRRHEAALDEWKKDLPDWLRPGSLAQDRLAAGALSLQLSYLAVQMCLCRIALLVELHRSEADVTEERSYHQSQCRRAAQAVIDFVVSLTRNEMDAFWLPYTAYHFTSAATLILRCALEADNAETAQECVASAKTLVDLLRRARDTHNWDLADICLGQCGAVVDKLCDSSFLHTWRRIPHEAASSIQKDGIETPLPAAQQEQQPAPGVNLEGMEANGYVPGFLPETMSFPSMESFLFPDLWQMPSMDDFAYRGG